MGNVSNMVKSNENMSNNNKCVDSNNNNKYVDSTNNNIRRLWLDK